MQQIKLNAKVIHSIHVYALVQNDESISYDFVADLHNIAKTSDGNDVLNWINSLDFSEYVDTFMKFIKGDLHQEIEPDDQPFTKFYYSFRINPNVKLDVATGRIMQFDNDCYDADWRALLVTDEKTGRANMVTASVRIEKVQQ